MTFFRFFAYFFVKKWSEKDTFLVVLVGGGVKKSKKKSKNFTTELKKNYVFESPWIQKECF
jgi:hypothetical protein